MLGMQEDGVHMDLALTRTRCACVRLLLEICLFRRGFVLCAGGFRQGCMVGMFFPIQLFGGCLVLLLMVRCLCCNCYPMHTLEACWCFMIWRLPAAVSTYGFC